MHKLPTNMKATAEAATITTETPLPLYILLTLSPSLPATLFGT